MATMTSSEDNESQLAVWNRVREELAALLDDEPKLIKLSWNDRDEANDLKRDFSPDDPPKAIERARFFIDRMQST